MTNNAVALVGFGTLLSNPSRTDKHQSVRSFPDLALHRPQNMERWPRLGRYGQAIAHVIDTMLQSSSTHTPGDRTALIVVSERSCLETNTTFDVGFITKGPRFASPKLFPYTLPGSVAAEAAIHFGIAGPYWVMPGGPTTALMALTLASDLLDLGQAEGVVIVAADVLGPHTLQTLPEANDADPPWAEGAVAVYLKHANFETQGSCCALRTSFGAVSTAWATLYQQLEITTDPTSIFSTGFSRHDDPLPVHHPDAIDIDRRYGRCGAVTGLLAFLAAFDDMGQTVIAAKDPTGKAIASVDIL